MKPNRYVATAAEARDEAIHWHHWMNDQNLSWGEIADRFPELQDEFTENGII